MKRLALIGIMVYDRESASQLNEYLSEFGLYFIGRMGLPYKEREVNIISIVIDAPQNVISSLTGKIGKLPNVNVQVQYAKEKN